jgi:hypothetical protein
VDGSETSITNGDKSADTKISTCPYVLKLQRMRRMNTKFKIVAASVQKGEEEWHQKGVHKCFKDTHLSQSEGQMSI